MAQSQGSDIVITGLRGAVVLDASAASLLVEVLAVLPQHGLHPNARLADVESQLRKACANASEPPRNACADERMPGSQSGSPQTAMYDLVNSKEAAEILGCTAANVRDLARRGRLPRHRAGRGWVYPAASVVALAEKRATQRG